MRGCHAKCFILRIAHRRRCCLCCTALAGAYSRTPFTRNCARDRGGYHYLPVRPWLGQGRSTAFNPLGAWTRPPPLPRRAGSRTCAGKRTSVVVCWLRFPAFVL